MSVPQANVSSDPSNEPFDQVLDRAATAVLRAGYPETARSLMLLARRPVEAGASIPTMTSRWSTAIRAINCDDFPPCDGAVLAELGEGVEFDRLIERATALAQDIGAPKQLFDLLRKLSDACNGVSVDASEHGYEVGYGDGWHSGAMAMLHLLGQHAGLSVPSPSKALSFILGLPGGHLRTKHL